MTCTSSALSFLLGPDDRLTVGRALAEFRAFHPVLIAHAGGLLLALPAEGLDAGREAAFAALVAPARPRLISTGERRTGEVAPASEAESAAIALAKLAELLPAVLAADVPGECPGPLVRLEAAAIERFRHSAARSLSIASEADIPLATGGRARFVVFRDRLGGYATAVIVGTPDRDGPVPVRIHSACLTGDVFGSRRCDCGDQLQLALAHLAALGGGIVLYLPQEGRGLGLANKMRAYALQDRGLDTVDANTSLGFEDDERDYGIAAGMLEKLGIARVLLMTNNPAKLAGLAKGGVAVAGRIPIEAAINVHNRRYMTAKAERAGHQLSLMPRKAG